MNRIISFALTFIVMQVAGCSHNKYHADSSGKNRSRVSSGFKKKDVEDIMKKVAYWQIDRDYGKSPINLWVVGSMFVGMTEYAKWSRDEYLQGVVKKHCESVDWKMGNNIYHADHHTIGQTYLMFYELEKNPVMISGVKERLDYILANPSKATLRFTSEKRTRWDWCDALFMAPPVWTHLSGITGDPKYLEFMNEEYMLTTDYLYDKEKHLYYRDDRYFEKREANGEKVFWSRGNGWVFGGLCRVLDQMPKDYHNRARYEQIFKEMADKLVSILPEDNLWHSSLLDPVSYPVGETSGSGFYLYGIAWGVNNGILDKDRFLPYIKRVWPALAACVHEDGKLGYVQAIGADPREVKADDTQLYGVGAFLLAGLEIYKMSE
ncbi:glycoside hydrolase family 88 protein [Candidatus Sumerlaeota bacterium]|nr:glycoside hydrolase family 88 protein [Candidatus Sumerlaeota bacterium]